MLHLKTYVWCPDTRKKNSVINSLVTTWKRKKACSSLSRGCLFSLRMRHPFFPSGTSGSFCKFKFFCFFFKIQFNLVLFIYSLPTMVCYYCWNRQEESVKKRVNLSCLKICEEESEEERTRERYTAYIAQERSPGQNGISHSHWTEYINWKPRWQNDSHTK